MRKLAPRSNDATRADNRARMEAHRVAVRLLEFGRQLVIAAALCEAWRLYPCDWRPGCERRAP